ncbi:hypothetical protein QUF74_19045 [Candidatus Halobeggiatoa sp. HSG11]|nr:hypothetical protein [Candidatus Halobeggiatoa sp. HSG11]
MRKIRDRIVSMIVFCMALMLGVNALAETHQFTAFKNAIGDEYLFANKGGGDNLQSGYDFANYLQEEGDNLQSEYGTHFNEWYTFLVISNDDGTFNVRTVDGSYFQTYSNGLTRTVTVADENNLPANTFYTPIDMGNGLYTGTASNGKYLNVVGYNNEYNMSFDGIDDYIEIEGFSGITGTDARTVQAWIKTTDSNGAIASWGENASGQKWTFRVQDTNGTSGAIRVEVNGGYVVGSTVVNDGRWHHVSATFEDDGSPDVTDVKLYVDGILEEISASTPQAINTGDTTNVKIGNDHSDRYFKGQIDEVQIWNTARGNRADMYKMFENQPNALIANYNFENDVDSTVTDSSLNGYYGTSHNGPIHTFYAVMKNRYALSFDGTNDFINTRSNIINLGTSDFTIETWIKTTGTNVGIITADNDDGKFKTGEMALYLGQDGKPYYVNLSNNNINGSSAINDGKWHHIAVTQKYNSDTATASGKIYVDGIDNTAYFKNRGSTNKNSNIFRIAKKSRGDLGLASKFFNGEMDEIRFWNIARSESEIQANMNKRFEGTESGLVAYYNFDDNDDDPTITDRSVNSYDGILKRGSDGNGGNFIGRDRVLSTDYLQFDSASPLAPVFLKNLEELVPDAPVGARFVALHASVNETDENGNDISYEGFVVAEQGENHPQANANKTTVAGWETFRYIDMGDGTVRLQVAKNGEYLKANSGGGKNVIQGVMGADGNYFTFKVIRGLPMLANDEVMFRTHNNHYLNITPEGGLKATATTYGPETVFRVVELERPFSLPNGEVMIQTASSKYFRTDANGGVYADADEWLRFSSTFNLTNNKDEDGNDDGTVLLETVYGRSETFDIVTGLTGLLEDNEVLLRHTSSGYYVNANPDGMMEMTATNYHDAGIFVITPKVTEAPTKSTVSIKERDNGETKYIASIPDYDYIKLRKNSTSMADNIAFTMLEYSNGDVQFMDRDGEYLSVGGDNKLVSAGQVFIPETFKLLPSNWTITTLPGARPFKLQTYEGLCLEPHIGTDNYVKTNVNCENTTTDWIIIDHNAYPAVERVTITSEKNGNYIRRLSSHVYGTDYPDNEYGMIAVDAELSGSANSSKFVLERYLDLFTLRTMAKTYMHTPTEIGNSYLKNEFTEPEWFRITQHDNGTMSFWSLERDMYVYVDNRDMLSMRDNDTDDDSRFTINTGDELLLAVDMLNEDDPDNVTLSIPVSETGGSDKFILGNVEGGDMQMDEWGVLESFSGTTDSLSFPNMGAMDIFSSLSKFSEPVKFNYDFGSKLNSSFPLNADLKYFNLEMESGLNFKFGDAYISVGDSSQTKIAIDHRSPAVFMYTDAPIFGPLIEGIGFGISGRNNIPFTPSIAGIRVPDYDSNDDDPIFYGSIWLDGTFNLPVIPTVLEDFISVKLGADATIALANDMELESGKFLSSNSFEQLGANGELDAKIDLCGKIEGVECGFNIDLAEASFILNLEEDPWIAFSGRIDPSKAIELPFGLEIPVTGGGLYAAVDTYIDENDPYLSLYAKIGDFKGLPGVKLEGLFKVDTHGVEFGGYAGFGPVLPKISISGTASADKQSFTGRIERSIGGKVKIGTEKVSWRVKGFIDVEIIIRKGNPDIAFKTKLKACGAGKCDSVKGTVSIGSDGRIELCANVPVVGNQCGKI